MSSLEVGLLSLLAVFSFLSAAVGLRAILGYNTAARTITDSMPLRAPSRIVGVGVLVLLGAVLAVSTGYASVVALAAPAAVLTIVLILAATLAREKIPFGVGSRIPGRETTEIATFTSGVTERLAEIVSREDREVCLLAGMGVGWLSDHLYSALKEKVRAGVGIRIVIGHPYPKGVDRPVELDLLGVSRSQVRIYRGERTLPWFTIVTSTAVSVQPYWAYPALRHERAIVMIAPPKSQMYESVRSGFELLWEESAPDRDKRDDTPDESATDDSPAT